MDILDSLQRPVRFDYLSPYLAHVPRPKILDVGCGNHSARNTKKYVPACLYHGLDIVPVYNNGPSDLESMDKFFEADLNRSDLTEIPSDYYDLVIFSHVIEHLKDGLKVLDILLTKITPGGVIYIETPHPRSEHFPSMKGTLNFWDDASHVRIYGLEEITAVLGVRKFTLLFSGSRRSVKRMILAPVHCLNSLFRDGYIAGTAFWDILGFANAVVARRPTGG